MIRPKIEKWMREVVESRSYRDFDDLHIDEVDPRFRNPDTWVSGALQCLQVALLVRTSQRLDFTVSIGMSLHPAEQPQGIAIDGEASLLAEIDDSPPSLYLFKRGEEPWHNDRLFREIKTNIDIRVNSPAKFLFHEWFDSNDSEFRRSIWIVG